MPVALAVALVLLVAAAFAATAPSALAAPEASAAADATDLAGATEVPDGFPESPADYAVDARQALRAADADPKILALKVELAAAPGNPELTASLKAEGVRTWEVGYFDGEEKVNLVVVDATTGAVTESWTGSQVDWPMARGRDGQFGHVLNSPWVWIPFSALLLAGLMDFRRPWRWVHLDLLVLLSFGISLAFFNSAEIGVSVPLYYPPLLYLLARMLRIGFRGIGAGRGGGGLRPSMPYWLTTTLVVALIIVRVAGNVGDSGVIDVGYASVIGADKITDAKPIYGEQSFPDNNPTGDTYGPANYFAYVPFEEALPWSGDWDDLPAAHVAAISFDLLTILGLFFLGRTFVHRRERERGDSTDTEPGTGLRNLRRALVESPANSAGMILAFAWLACPFTAYALQSNSNDALVSALLVWSLVLFALPLVRGGLLAIAALTKFAPLALFPLYAAGERGLAFRLRGGDDAEPGRRLRLLRPVALVSAAFGAGAVLLLAHPAVDPGLAAFYERTVGSQVGRESPFSIWGQADLEWLHTLVKMAAVALAIAVAFVPARRSLPQIAALSAAVVIAVQLTVEHWFYLYIPWFLVGMLAAIVLAETGREAGEQGSRELSTARTA